MRKLLLTTMVLALAACGDPATEDDRGYTKAPLEQPGLLIAGEPASASDVETTLEPGLTATPPTSEVPAASGGGEEQESPGQEASLAPGVTQEAYDRGAELFAGQGGCQTCHGANGAGSQLAPDLTDDEWLHVSSPEVDALAEVIQTGVAEPQQFPAPMPPMGGASLSEDQVRALAAYIASIAQR